ncbi:Hypothetical protein PHPALM_36177 [Phytophthora palmivora]|uniref:HTH CENPB-type domain-containing protein n=1 Tax=Phytophthora palmivora TaxID=4796 RepID=A0A2P4X0L3_9STRA|nr:Hypothetical protein PHPALM_36177 [Phytophthora palmivora]
MARTPISRSRAPGQRKGRTRTTGSGKAPKQYKRIAVSYRHKLDVIEFYDAIVTKNKMKTCVEHFIQPSRQINLNKIATDLIIEKCETGCGSLCKDRSSGMSATLSPAFEEQLVIWINSLRKDGVPVTGTMVRIRAKQCYESAGLPVTKFI